MKPILLLLIPFLLFAQTYITEQSGIVGPTTGTGTYVFEQSGLVFNSSGKSLSFDSVSVKIDGAFHKLASGDSVYWLDTLLYSITGAEDWLSTIDSMYIGLIKQPVLSATDTTITLEIREWLAPGWLQFSISDETTTDTCTDPDSVWMEADYRAPPAPVIDSIVPQYSWADSAFNVYASNFTDSAKSFCKANSVNLTCIDFGNPKRYKLPSWTPPGLYWLKIGTIEDTDSTVTDSLRVRVLKFEVLDGSEQ